MNFAVRVWTCVYTVSHAAVSFICSYFEQRYKENRWDPKRLIGSGGMPSSHSATVTALAVAIGFQDGFNCSLFATATIFASVVGYISYPSQPLFHPNKFCLLHYRRK
jgi:acid phosphatase family membrane protein YuiD